VLIPDISTEVNIHVLQFLGNRENFLLEIFLEFFTCVGVSCVNVLLNDFPLVRQMGNFTCGSVWV
jgi:hypothetical protein